MSNLLFDDDAEFGQSWNLRVADSDYTVDTGDSAAGQQILMKPGRRPGPGVLVHEVSSMCAKGGHAQRAPGAAAESTRLLLTCEPARAEAFLRCLHKHPAPARV